MLPKMGPFFVFELLALRVEDGSAQHVRRHQVRCELDAGELCVDGAGEQLCRERFGHAGHAFYENVAVGEQARDEQVCHLVLAYDHFADLRFDGRNRFVQLAEVRAGRKGVYFH